MIDFKQTVDRLKNLPTRNHPGIFFMHIPKTGGTSLIHALKRRYPFQFFKIEAGSTLRAAKKKHGKNYTTFEQCYDLRESVAIYAMEAGYKCIAGHVPYSVNIFENPENRHLLMTILRDPVDRFISKYMYNYHKSSDHCKYEMSFSEYIESKTGKISGAEYLRYLSGYSLENNSQSFDDLVQLSKENIKKFDLIGLLEKLDRFSISFKKKTGLKLNIPHKNKTSDFIRDPRFKKSEIDQVQEICKYDIELYNFVKSSVEN